jgi:DNA-binding transcriptional regulator WhiA
VEKKTENLHARVEPEDYDHITELGDVLNISKSGVLQRFIRLSRMAGVGAMAALLKKLDS